MKKNINFILVSALFLGYFVLIFNQNTYAQHTNINTIVGYLDKFQIFSKKFPAQELPFDINQKTMDKGGLGLQRLSELEINTFLKQAPLDTTQNVYMLNYTQAKDGHSPSSHYANNEEKNLLNIGKVKYFILKKFNLFPNTTSLLVYFLDKSKPLGQGLIEWKYILFNYNQKGELINSILFAHEEYFMSRRYLEGLLKKNDKNELIFENTEINYEGFDKKPKQKPTYQVKRHFLLDNNFNLQYISDRYYPCMGTFVAGNEKITIDQNVNSFLVLEGIIGENVMSGQELLKYDLKTKSFTFKHIRLGILSGVFNADYSEITITNDKNEITIFKRTSKY